MRHFALILALLLATGLSAAQIDSPTPITAENVHALHLAHGVRFDALPAPQSGEAAVPLSGWFTLSPDGTRAAFVVTGGVRMIDIGDPAGINSVWTDGEATVLDAHWSDDSRRLAVITQSGDGYALTILSESAPYTLAIPTRGIPVRVWPDAEHARYVWIEETPAPDDADRSGFRVMRLDLDDPTAEPFTLPTGPEHDFDSLVRIGRIPAPLAITATFAGTVRRWDLQTGEITAEVTLPLAPTFGRVNETNGVEFAWRDEASTALHLLNFETGENRTIAPLDGDYIQALLVTPDASVILAVHRGDEASITAWDAATGAAIDLGGYDTDLCSRVPDMVQLARSGTALVIGCDAGYQVWTVGE